MLKSYILIHDFALSTPIDVNGKTVTIEFCGGSKQMRTNGEFCTSDKKLQKAIENDSGFGHIFKLHRSYGEDSTDKKTIVEEVKLKEKVFRTVNEASEWLVSKGCKKSEVLTSGNAIQAAKELGYDLKFNKEG